MSYGIKKTKSTMWCPAVVLKIETKDIKDEEMVTALFEKVREVIVQAFSDYPEINFNYMDPEHDDFPKHWKEFASNLSGTWE